MRPAAEGSVSTETSARHPKVLIISQGAPGVGKDANSIMLQRLLVSFPKDSYVVLASSHNWPDGPVPEGQWSKGYRCFRNSLRGGGSQTGRDETPMGTPPHAAKWKLLVPVSVRHWLRAIFTNVVLDRLAVVVQTCSATAEAVTLVRSEAITSIMAVSDYGPCLIAGWMAHRRTGVPLDVFIFDLWRGNVFPWYQRFAASLFQHHIFAASRWVFCSGEGIGEYLRTELGPKSVVINNSVVTGDALTVPGSRSRSASPMTVVLTGAVYWAQLDAVLDMVTAVRDLVGVEFHVYSRQSADQVATMGVTGKNVVLHPTLPEDEVRDCQAAADVLFLPLSFNGKGRHIIETAQPAKSVEYMASGVPILVHAPPYAFVTRYAREHDIATVADQPGSDELKRVLMALMSDRTDAQRKAERAVELAGRSYDSLDVSHRLQSHLLYERPKGSGG